MDDVEWQILLQLHDPSDLFATQILLRHDRTHRYAVCVHVEAAAEQVMFPMLQCVDHSIQLLLMCRPVLLCTAKLLAEERDWLVTLAVILRKNSSNCTTACISCDFE